MTIDYAAHNEDRMRRAKSWLIYAEDEGRSDEEAFVGYWIAFNAAYGRPYVADGEYVAEYRIYMAFIRNVIDEDKQKAIQNYLTKEVKDVQKLIGNKYIFEPFWLYMRGKNNADWETRFNTRNIRVLEQWGKGNAARMLGEILFRLYTLRNQLMHGGVTYQTGKGRNQLRDGREIMGNLIPLILNVMQINIAANPSTDEWGEVAYLSVMEGALPFAE